MEDAPRLLKLQVTVSRYLDTSATTQAQILVRHRRSRCSPWTKSERKPTCGTLVGKTIWKSSSGTCLVKNIELGMPVRSSNTRSILIGTRGQPEGWGLQSASRTGGGPARVPNPRACKHPKTTIGQKNGWKKAEAQSCVEEIDDIGWSWRTDIIPWPRLPGMHSTWIANRTKVLLIKYRNMFESRISAGATEKLPGWEKLHANTTDWSKKSCTDMRGTILRIKNDSETVQSLYTMSWRPLL